MCDKNFKMHESLVETIIVKIEPKSYDEDDGVEQNNLELLECDNSTKVESDLPPATEAIYLDVSTSNIKYEVLNCDLCDFQSYDKNSIMFHLKTFHQVFMCDKCDFQGTSKRSLSGHKGSHRIKQITIEKLNTVSSVLICDICNYKCSDKLQLVKHIRHCRFRVKQREGEEPTQCDFCEYRSFNKFFLEIHMRYHTGEKPFKCELCEYKSASHRSLRIHMRVHTGEKPHACNLCDSKFAQRANLKSHMTRHTGVKAYSCESCDMKFSIKSSLNRHVKRIHKKVKNVEIVKADSEVVNVKPKIVLESQ